jgi:hypothetical protein
MAVRTNAARKVSVCNPAQTRNLLSYKVAGVGSRAEAAAAVNATSVNTPKRIHPQ